MRKYYEAYDDRYRQVHAQQLRWSSSEPSDIVGLTMERFGIARDGRILELGCGEGRDASVLLTRGYDVTAVDISSEAIRYCREHNPEYGEHFQVLDCIDDRLDAKYDFIYAVAVIHMLVEDDHRAAFYRFIREHLKENGLALVCSMGDGTIERKSDISTAFELQERTHGETGRKLLLAGTSCRMVTWEVFLREIEESGMQVVERGLSPMIPHFPVVMYAVMKK